jgi:starvation-inducible DNA-binding protein
MPHPTHEPGAVATAHQPRTPTLQTGSARGDQTPDRQALLERRAAPLATPSDLKPDAVRDVSTALTALLADMFALFAKAKNFHWHMSGPHFRDYHLMLDEQANQIFSTTDAIAERVRKIGGTTLRSIGHIGRLQRLLDNDAEFVSPGAMLAELRDDNKQIVIYLREVHSLCSEHNDVATASLLEVWIDEAEHRAWFLFETTRRVSRVD